MVIDKEENFDVQAVAEHPSDSFIVSVVRKMVDARFSPEAFVQLDNAIRNHRSDTRGCNYIRITNHDRRLYDAMVDAGRWKMLKEVEDVLELGRKHDMEERVWRTILQPFTTYYTKMVLMSAWFSENKNYTMCTDQIFETFKNNFTGGSRAGTVYEHIGDAIMVMRSDGTFKTPTEVCPEIDDIIALQQI